MNSFWVDVAQYLVSNKGQLVGFLSENFIYATGNHAEMMCVLGFMDMKLSGAVYDMQMKAGRKLEISAKENTNLIIFLK